MASEPTSQPAPPKLSPEEEAQRAKLAQIPSLKKFLDVPEDEIVESHDGREVTLLKYIYNHPKLDSELRGSPSAILAAMDEFATQEEFLINIGYDKAKILTDLIHEYKPKVLLELGTYVGYAFFPFLFPGLCC